MGVKLSKKHGVNPTIPLCFWCWEEKNEVVLLGKLPNDMEAPKHMWIPGDYEPCEKCKEIWDKGIAVIEASLEPVLSPSQPRFHEAYPTGEYVVLSEDAVHKMFNDDDFEKAKKLGLCFIDHAGIEYLKGLFKKAQEGPDSSAT